MLEALKSPIMIRNLQIRNRVVLSPVTTRFASESGAVTKQLIDYHVERAKAGVGLQILENVCIQDQPPAYMLRIHTDGVIAGFNELAEAIKGWGARAGIQLNPMGAIRQGTDVNKLTTEQIFSLMEDFTAAALRSKTAGFDLPPID